MSATDIRELIQRIAKQGNGDATDIVFDATVVAVGDECITVDVDGLELTNVRTCAMASDDEDDDSLHIYPKVGSAVVCLDCGGNRTDVVVVQYSQIDKVTIHGGEQSTPNGTELKKQLETLTKRVDALYDAINNGVPGSQDGGEALQKSMKGIIAGKETEDWSNIEDETLKH